MRKSFSAIFETEVLQYIRVTRENQKKVRKVFFSSFLFTQLSSEKKHRNLIKKVDKFVFAKRKIGREFF